MEHLKQLIYSVFVLSFLCGIYRLLASKNSQQSASLQLGAGLLSVALLCVPVLRDFDFSLPDFAYEDFTNNTQTEQWQQALLATSQTTLEEEWKTTLCQRFSIPENQCAVKCTLYLQDETVFCRELAVTITQNHAYKKSDMTRYLEKYCDGTVSVTVWEEDT